MSSLEPRHRGEGGAEGVGWVILQSCQIRLNVPSIGRRAMFKASTLNGVSFWPSLAVRRSSTVVPSSTQSFSEQFSQSDPIVNALFEVQYYSSVAMGLDDCGSIKGPVACLMTSHGLALGTGQTF